MSTDPIAIRCNTHFLPTLRAVGRSHLDILKCEIIKSYGGPDRYYSRLLLDLIIVPQSLQHSLHVMEEQTVCPLCEPAGRPLPQSPLLGLG